LSNPDQDPHLFEASPSFARSLSAAAIVVYNGADYDPWMARLLAASHSVGRKVIIVANLMHTKAGHNPHLWYDPATMPVYAKAVTAALVERDPGHRPNYDRQLQRSWHRRHRQTRRRTPSRCHPSTRYDIRR
jgi:zinc/manganese transport system substrate-binding protein